jgi:agmatine/peptidylarginine deiminase
MVMLTWPHQETDWNQYLEDITRTYVEMADAITQRERLLVVTPHPVEVGAILGRHLTASQMAQVTISYCKTNDTWARDHGPISLVGEDSDGKKKLLCLDFCFNGWGDKFPADLDNKITRNVFSELFSDEILNGDIGSGNDDFVLEGGSIESDGKGTIFTTECCLMAPHRNQPLTKEEIEQEMKLRLKARSVVWLQHGAVPGDDTDGHIDTTVRLAPDDTIVYCHPADKKELEALRTIDGKPYRLLELPTPEVEYDGEVLPATYANFLIINGAVIVPVYDNPEKDRMACEIIQSAFPNRTIIPIDATVIVRQHGSIHCCTMQIPQTTQENEDRNNTTA